MIQCIKTEPNNNNGLEVLMPINTPPAQPLSPTELFSRFLRELTLSPPLRSSAPTPLKDPKHPEFTKVFKLYTTYMTESELLFTQAAWRLFFNSLEKILLTEFVRSVFPALLKTLNISNDNSETAGKFLLLALFMMVVKTSKEVNDLVVKFGKAENNAHVCAKFHGKIHNNKFSEKEVSEKSHLYLLSWLHLVREVFSYFLGNHSYKKPLCSIEELKRHPKKMESHNKLATQQLEAEGILLNVGIEFIKYIGMLSFFIWEPKLFISDTNNINWLPVILGIVMGVIGMASTLTMGTIDLTLVDRKCEYLRKHWDTLSDPVEKSSLTKPEATDNKPT